MSVDPNIDVFYEMFFLSLTNTEVQFDIRNLTWRIYSTTKALLITRQVELIDKYKFPKANLDKNSETFIIHVPVLEAVQLVIHPF